MEHLIQLHEHIEIHYHVDCYEAQLYTHDGNRMVMSAEGTTIAHALCNLETEVMVKRLTLDELRVLPEESMTTVR